VTRKAEKADREKGREDRFRDKGDREAELDTERELGNPYFLSVEMLRFHSDPTSPFELPEVVVLSKHDIQEDVRERERRRERERKSEGAREREREESKEKRDGGVEKPVLTFFFRRIRKCTD
jgi:hypothetical protein